MCCILSVTLISEIILFSATFIIDSAGEPALMRTLAVFSSEVQSKFSTSFEDASFDVSPSSRKSVDDVKL